VPENRHAAPALKLRLIQGVGDPSSRLCQTLVAVDEGWEPCLEPVTGGRLLSFVHPDGTAERYAVCDRCFKVLQAAAKLIEECKQ
jgi:hypothetical protein